MSALDTLSHWRLARDPDGLAWLTFDRAASAVNALSADTMAELALVLDALDKDPPGPGDPLGQADRLHRGRRCQRIRQPGHARAGPRAGGARLEPVQPAGRRALSHAGPDPGPLPGWRPELALACRYRLVADQPGVSLALPEVMLGIFPAGAACCGCRA